MRKPFTLTITRLGKMLLTFQAVELMLPSNSGYIGIMADRQPLLTTLEPGLVTLYDIEDKKKIFGITGGFVEVINNHVTLLCDWLMDINDLEYDEAIDKQKLLYFKKTDKMTEHQKREYVKGLLHRHNLKFSAKK